MRRLFILTLAAIALVACDKKTETSDMAGAESDSAAIANLEASHPGLFLKPTPAQVAAATPLHNPLCPTDGEKNGSMGAPVQVVYKGKVVDLCCSGCPAEFGADPDKFLALAEAGKFAE